MGRGSSPAWPPGRMLDYLLVRRQPVDGGRSLFLTLFDAFQAQPVVQGVRVRSEDPLVLAVTLADGVDEITLHTPEGPTGTTDPRPVGLRVRSRRGDVWTRDVRVGQWDSSGPQGYVETSIQDLDYHSREIGVAYKPGYEKVFVPGRALRIYNAGRSGLFRIENTRREDDRLCLTLDYTALYARAPVTHVSDAQVWFDADFVFAALDGHGGGRPRLRGAHGSAKATTRSW